MGRLLKSEFTGHHPSLCLTHTHTYVTAEWDKGTGEVWWAQQHFGPPTVYKCAAFVPLSSLYYPPSLHPFSLQLFTFPYTYLRPRCLLLAPLSVRLCHGREEAAAMSHRWLSPLYVIVFSRWLPQGLYPSKCTVSHHCYCLCGRLPVHAGAKSALVLSLRNHCAREGKVTARETAQHRSACFGFWIPLSTCVCVCHGSDWWRDVCKEIGRGGLSGQECEDRRRINMFFFPCSLHHTAENRSRPSVCSGVKLSREAWWGN